MAAGSPPVVGPDFSAVSGVLPKVVGDANPWLPLADGNSWAYAVVGEVNSPQYTMKVVSSFARHSIRVFRCETVLSRDKPVPFQYLETAEQVWRRNRITAPESRWSVEFQLPPPGDRGEASPLNGHAAPPDQISVPAGGFVDTTRIRQTSSSGTYDLWFARNVGLVKRVSVSTGLTEVLLRYQVAKSPERR